MGRTGDDRALGLALARGLIRLRDVQVAAASSEEESRRAGPVPRGPSALEVLVRLGVLTEVQAEELRGDVPVPSPSAPGASTAMAAGAGDRFVLEDELGQGGMGQVFRAFDTRLGRFVALKLLKGESREDAARFLAEARAQARLEHEGIARVYDAGELDGRPFIAMQLVRGGTIGRIAPALTLAQRVGLMRRVAEAVHAAHQAGLVHRDLKPSNILLERNEAGAFVPYVVDFGLARSPHERGITESGRVVGTIHYMAPEQAFRGTIDRRTDVYGLGATLYELISGKMPFEELTGAEVLARLHQEDPVPLATLAPEVPRDLATIVGRCLEKDPERRYATARELAEDLGRFEDGEPILARRPTLAFRVRRLVRRNRAAAGVAALSAVLLLGAGVALGVSRWQLARRTGLAARFGRDVSEIETVLRLGRMLPLHDLARERVLVRARMRALEAEGRRLGGVARGPLAYALGRGHLALGELGPARDRLEECLRSGETSGEARLALGAALSGLWEEERRAARAVSDAGQRRALLAAAEKRHGARVRELLATSATGVEGAELFRARLLLVEGRTRQAATEAGKALAARPWLAEARGVEGLALAAEAEAALDGGKPEDARALFDRAESALGEGLRIAPSHDELLADLAQVRADRVAGELWRGKRRDLPSLGERALAAVRSGLVAGPEDLGLETLSAFTCARLAEAKVYFDGTDPVIDLDAGEAAARRVLARDGRNAPALEVLGDLLLTRADHVVKRDPVASLGLYDASAATLDRVLTVAPGRGPALALRGIAYSQKGRAEKKLGRDPRASLRKAAESQRASLAAGQSVGAWVGLQNTLNQIANHAATVGDDPGPDCEAVLEAGRNALRLAPKSTFARNANGNAHYVRAKGELWRGVSPAASLELARRAFHDAIALDGKDAFTWFNLASAERLEARWRLLSGADPLPSVAASLEAAARGLALDDTYPSNLAERAQLRAIEVEARAARGLPWREALAAGRADVAAALAKAPGFPDALLASAQLERAALAAGEPGGASRAVAALERSLAATPNDAEAHLVKARLALAGGLPIADGLAAADRALELRRAFAEAARARVSLERLRR